MSSRVADMLQKTELRMSDRGLANCRRPLISRRDVPLDRALAASIVSGDVHDPECQSVRNVHAGVKGIRKTGDGEGGSSEAP